ncbi:MAG: thiamine pyrophosphate-requiring protein [Chloroflexi bacterium]|nr:thiamine pyrophosphate-requiring protein [Chloroflexota bacterium]
MNKTVEVGSVAEAYLELLAARNIEYFFGNGGTDFAPIIEAYAKRRTQEQPLPKPIPVPHEVTAVAMAHGYTMITGRPQVVMVHTIPGTANAMSGVINAFKSNIPMLFTAGRTPIAEGDALGSRNGSIHWAQESFDQGSMVREWVKWDYELRHGADLESVVDRALAIAQSQPAGPVYLSLPREVLAEELESISYAAEPRMKQAEERIPTPEAIAQAASLLAKAKDPILVTRAAGKDTRTIQPLVELAELLGMAVIDAGALYANFPKSNPLYGGGDVGSSLKDADVVVVLEADVPWTTAGSGPPSDARIIGIGEDPLFSTYPVRGFHVDFNLAGSPRLTMEALVNAVKDVGVDPAAVQARKEKWSSASRERRQAAEKRAEDGKHETPISKAWFSRCLAEVLGENTILLNELGIDVSQIDFDHPGTFFGTPPSAALGWALGASLGSKLAAPEKTVVCCIGDGSYIFGSGTATHIVSNAQNLPVLNIVWNNGIWNAVQNATKVSYADGYAVKNNDFAVSTLDQTFQYELICQAAGGYAERVEDPSDVPAAIQRGLHAVNVEKRQALLNIIGQ